MKKTLSILAALGVMAMTTNAIAGGYGYNKNKSNIVETAAAAGQFETLIAAAKAAGLVEALTSKGPLTVFAPTDAAFAALPAGTVEMLLLPENKEQLARILKFHVVSGKIKSKSLSDGIAVDTLAGAEAVVTATDSGFAIAGANIVKADIGASNGVVHVIDKVILPPQKVTKAY